MKIIGYTISISSKYICTYKGMEETLPWKEDHNKKLYSTLRIAEEAVEQMKNDNNYIKWQSKFTIIPLYVEE